MGMNLRDHVLVVGHGRSGTNLVLDLFDTHPNTVCRNEPNELAGTAFQGLGDPMFGDDSPDTFDANWRKACTETFATTGARDRFRTDKAYFRSRLHAKIAQSLQARGKVRAMFLPQIGGRVREQWRTPSLFIDSAKKERALPVLKLLLTPQWVIRAHEIQSNQRVVHVIRRPQGFVQSWWGRYVNGPGGGPEKVFADNFPSLRRILDGYGRSTDMPGEYSQANLVRSELWRWRYINERMIEHLANSKRYFSVGYEELMNNRLQHAEQLFEFAGLAMNRESRATISGMQNRLFPARKPNALDPGLVEDAVAHVMSDSRFRTELLAQPKN